MKDCGICQQSQVLGLSAMTQYKCAICKKECLHGNSNTPAICGECAEKNELCQYCLTDLHNYETSQKE